MSIYMILQTESVISVSKGGNMGNLNETPSANRLHIGIYGKTNISDKCGYKAGGFHCS